LQAASVDGDVSKCLATPADDNQATSTQNIDRATVEDDVTTPADHGAADDDNERRLVDDVLAVAPSGETDYVVDRVIPVEANVVLVSRPGDHPPTIPDITVQLNIGSTVLLCT